MLAGLVLDLGAIFQHAALIARESGLPAVIRAREGTSVIEEGQRLLVDGDAGVVTLLS